MWTVIKIGAQQYKVKEGDLIQTQRIKDQEEKKITFDTVMLFSNKDKVQIGKPYLKDVKVEAEIVGEEKAKKTIVFKFKRRKGYQKKRGHRQIHSFLKILKIKGK